MEEVLARYFQEIDAARESSNFSFLPEIFAHNCMYERLGTPTLNGLGALTTFYENDCVIKTGRHTIESSQVTGPLSIVAHGVFNGIKTTGDPIINLAFIDYFDFNDELKVVRRRTVFPGEKV